MTHFPFFTVSQKVHFDCLLSEWVLQLRLKLAGWGLKTRKLLENLDSNFFFSVISYYPKYSVSFKINGAGTFHIHRKQ